MLTFLCMYSFAAIVEDLIQQSDFDIVPISSNIYVYSLNHCPVA